MNDQDIEDKIKAAGLTAPRVAKETIDELMDGVTYHVSRVGETTVTAAFAFLSNGFMLAVGTSACVSVENYNYEIDKEIAIKEADAKARDKLWELEGYHLKKQLAVAEV